MRSHTIDKDYRAMDMTQLLETEYKDIPMDDRHKVVGAAAYYLDMVERTNTIPGIEEAVVVDMGVWCYHSVDCTVEACLAGIWYMGTTSKLLDLSLLSGAAANILVYLDEVATTEDTELLHELVGLEGFDTCDDEGWAMEDVQQRLHSLMRVVPAIKEAYLATAVAKACDAIDVHLCVEGRPL